MDMLFLHCVFDKVTVWQEQEEITPLGAHQYAKCCQEQQLQWQLQHQRQRNEEELSQGCLNHSISHTDKPCLNRTVSNTSRSNQALQEWTAHRVQELLYLNGFKNSYILYPNCFT